MSTCTECPHTRSDYGPCIARDGSSALDDAGVCVGCGATPRVLQKDLIDRAQESNRVDAVLAVTMAPGKPSPARDADLFQRRVRAYVEAER